MSVLKIAVCDDNANELDMIREAIVSAFRKKGVDTEADGFSSCSALNVALKKTIFDLMFLDINIKDEDGIEFAESLRNRGNETDLIFLSGMENRVFDTFKVHPVGFVRKSAFFSDMVSVLDSYLAHFYQQKRENSFIVNGKNGVVSIDLSAVTYIESVGKRQTIHRVNGANIVAHNSLKDFAEKLEGFGFICIYKGILVNFKYVSGIYTDVVELSGGEKLPLSIYRAAEIKRKYVAFMNNR